MKDSTLGDRRFRFLPIGIGVLGVVVAAVACVGEDPDVAASQDGGSVAAEAGGASDAGDGKGEPDAAIDAAPCDLSKPFDPPGPVGGLSTPGVYEQSARLSRDERTAYVTLSNFNGKQEAGLYLAVRASSTLPFGEPKELYRTTSAAGAPTVSADGKVLVFVQGGDVPAERGLRWVRSSTGGLFTEPASPIVVSGIERVNTPFLRADGTALYFESGGASGEDWRIFRSDFSNGTLSGVRELTELDNQGVDTRDRMPIVSEDERTIYWSRIASGAYDIFVATRMSTDEPFSNVRPVGELNTNGGLEFPSWLSPDGCRLYYTFMQPDGNESDIFVASKPK